MKGRFTREICLHKTSVLLGDKQMNDFVLSRRQLLYLGLGTVGTGLTTACGAISNKDRGGAAKADRVSSANALPPKGSTKTAEFKSPLVQTKESAGAELPEFQEIQEWLNSTPLSKADLKGSVVLLQFWTLGCINCQRTLPYVTNWHQQFAAQGLKVIGVHTPEFPFERKVSNIQAAMKRHGINYPVAVDNGFKTWQAYKNEYWPHLFLADRQGVIQYDRIGEGAYPETAQMIQKLLKS
jgi:thiol-disulfide isomerase/thioredoxin